MARIPAFALIFFIYSGPADATAPVQDACDTERNELRTRATEVLGVPANTDFRDAKNNNAIIERYCDRSIDAPANKNRKGDGYCERTYRWIIALILSSDLKGEQACQVARAAAAKKASCLDGQADCQDQAAKAYREAAALMAKARDTTAAGLRNLDHQIKRHGQVAQKYARHLRVIADAIEANDRAQEEHRRQSPMAFRAQTMVERQRAISEEVRRRLNAQTKSVEGVDDVELVLKEYGLDLNPGPIRARAAEIDQASRITGSVTDVDFEKTYGDWPGEQFGARNHATGMVPVIRQANERLTTGATELERMALQIEQRRGQLGSVPEAERRPAPPPTRQETPAPRPAPVQIASHTPLVTTGASSPLVFSSGASMAPPSAGKAQAQIPKMQLSATEPAPARKGRGPALSPGELEILAEATGRPVSAAELDQDEETLAAQALVSLDEPAEPVAQGQRAAPPESRAPASQGEATPSLDSSNSSSPRPSANAARTAASPSAGNALAYADRQIARMEQGRRFGPNLRDQLRKRLAAKYQASQGNTRAAADLFEEMRKGPVEMELSAEEQMAALEAHGESLFARVHSAHRRVVAKAKVAFH